MNDPREQAFGDAVYDAWRRGMNPDLVSRDDVDEGWYRTYDVQHAADFAVERLADRSTRQSEEETTEEQQP